MEFQGSGGERGGGHVVNVNGHESGVALATDGTYGEASWRGWPDLSSHACQHLDRK